MKGRILAVVVVSSLLICSAHLTAKERRGAELIITKTDGQQIAGELIAAKPSSLLLFDLKTGADVSVEIGEVAVIKIIGKSKVWAGGAIGFIVGALVVGLGVNLAEYIDESYDIASRSWKGAMLGGVIFAIPGALIGAHKGKAKTIQIEGKS